MLLHALRVYQSKGSSDAIFDLLRDRDELARVADDKEPIYFRTQEPWEPIDIAALFHGRAPQSSPDPSILLESRGPTPNKLEISIDDAPAREASSKQEQLPRTLRFARDASSYLNIAFDEELLECLPVDDELVAPLLATGTLDVDQLAAWWDKLSLTDAEQQVIRCLQLISPIERIALVEHPLSRSRIALVKLEGSDNPIPSKALGDGVGRMFGMALALEIARSSKMLLIDEIENGIHYSILPEFWRVLFTASARSGTVLDDEDLRAATRDGIELR